MALIVEDGTIVVNANSYITVAEADSYHNLRGNTHWNGSNEHKEQAIIKACDYIELRWGPYIKGSVEDEEQVLSFPRSELYDRAGRLVENIPQKLKNAQAEYALKALSGSLFIEPVYQASGQNLELSREKIGPLETEVRYSQGGIKTLKQYPQADRWIIEYVSGAGLNGNLIRG